MGKQLHSTSVHVDDWINELNSPDKLAILQASSSSFPPSLPHCSPEQPCP